jgi:hypothetical protein
LCGDDGQPCGKKIVLHRMLNACSTLPSARTVCDTRSIPAEAASSLLLIKPSVLFVRTTSTEETATHVRHIEPPWSPMFVPAAWTSTSSEPGDVCYISHDLIIVSVTVLKRPLAIVRYATAA